MAGTILPAINLPQAKAADTQSSWTTMASMPTAREGLGVAVVGGKIFAIGGLNENNQPVNTNEMYNPQTNVWTSVTPMPTPRSGFAITVYQNKIYCVGGTVGTGVSMGYVGNNEMYDPVSNTWETKTSMPTPRADLCASLVDDEIYLIGGKKYSSVTPFYNETSINEVYNPANDSWTTKTAIPTPVQGYASTVVDGKIYFMGGSLQSLPLQNSLTTGASQVYDPKNDTWSSATALPYAVSYGAAVATEGFMAPPKIYCIGGYSGGDFSGQAQAYNFENDSWSPIESMPTPRVYLGLAVVSDVLYAIGGFDGTNWLNTNEQYKPVGYGTVPPKVEITSPENKTYANVTLAYTVNRGTQWIGYSLDNHANVTITETKLLLLSEGAHKITIYANDTLGNMGSSKTVFFSVDRLPPIIEITLPQNRSYDSTDIQLTFTVNENVSKLAYSLDGQANVTINGNVTLPALTNGGHTLTLYAADELGNSAEQMISFSIEPFPIISIVAVATLVTIALAGGYLLVKRRKTGGGKELEKAKKQTDALP